MSEEISELFPSESTDYYYEPYHKNSSGDSVRARGCLYSHYLYLRGLLREAGILKVDSSEEKTESPSQGT